MTSDEKLDFLKNAINSLFKKEVKELSLETILIDIGLDSLDIVELQMFYEEETGLEIIDTDSQPVTIGQLISIIP